MVWGTTSRQSRGYDARWTRTRLRILARDGGLCQCNECKASGVPMVASHVDHVVSKANAKRMGWSEARTEADDNLQSLHPDCHKKKTAEETGKTFRPKQRIGEDGFPIEE